MLIITFASISMRSFLMSIFFYARVRPSRRSHNSAVIVGHIDASSEVSYSVVSIDTNEASGLSSSKVSLNKTINVEPEKVC